MSNPELPEPIVAFQRLAGHLAWKDLKAEYNANERARREIVLAACDILTSIYLYARDHDLDGVLDLINWPTGWDWGTATEGADE